MNMMFSGPQAPESDHSDTETAETPDQRLDRVLAEHDLELNPPPVPDENGLYRAPSGQQVAMDPPRMADFLESLQTLGNVSIACARAGVARQTAYRARRRSPAFARAWDAALLASRTVAEAALAERAINGVEEAIYYHGEEVGSRRRYSDRLLLAHLARLDRLAMRADLAATLPLLDHQVEALRRGEALEEGIDERALEQAEQELERGLQPGDGKYLQDSVTPVTPCPDCGGFCEDAKASPKRRLTEEDCQWLGNRLDRMDAARPDNADPPHVLAAQGEGDTPEIEMLQLDAFEAGLPEWWLVTSVEALEEGALD